MSLVKILFLDFDGVLNNYKERNFGEKFSSAACGNLNLLLSRVPDLQIVVSSSWRIWGLDYLRKVLYKNGIDPERAIDVTGKEDGIRGIQIQAWLDRNPGVTNMVIIDDESDMGALSNKLAKTSMYVGLTSKEVDQAIEILSEPMNRK